MKNNKLVIFSILIGIIILSGIVFIIPKGTIANDDDGIEIGEDEEIIYYIDYYYGTDFSSIISFGDHDSFRNYLLDDETMHKDEVIVEDKLPLGLEFVGFLPTYDGSIGAVTYDSYLDKNVPSCGRIVDDTQEATVRTGTWNNAHTEYYYHGLHYDATTRTISYKIENICPNSEIVVGIIAKTLPLAQGTDRVDIYNMAAIPYNSYVFFSNTVHHFVGDDEAILYEVSFVDGSGYDIEVWLDSQYYTAGSEVLLPKEFKEKGYTFTGWSSNDVTITGDRFTMPSSDVEIEANFTPASKHTVTYSITGDVPDNYIVPETYEYYEGELVKVNKLSAGDVYGDYEFQGWTITGAQFGNNNTFIMPNQNVTLVGSFVDKEYTITYKFDDDLLPPNAASLLPAQESYQAGEVVTLPTFQVQGNYIFYGWKHEDNFKMPKKDLVIYGSWTNYGGELEPEYTMELVSNQTYYKPGDNILVKVNFDNGNKCGLFKLQTNANKVGEISYEDINGHQEEVYTDFENIGPENTFNREICGDDDSFVISYTVSPFARSQAEVTFDIIEAFQQNSTNRSNDTYISLAPNDYSQSINISIMPRLMLCSKTLDYNNSIYTNSTNISESYILTGENGYESKISIDNKCVNFYLEPGKYIVKQVLPFYIENMSINGIVNSDNTEFTMTSADNYLVYINKLKDHNDIDYNLVAKYWQFYGTVKNAIGKICKLSEGPFYPEPDDDSD